LGAGAAVLGGINTLAGALGSGSLLTTSLGTATTGVGTFGTAVKGIQALGAVAIAFEIGWQIGGVINETLNLEEPIQEAIRAIDKVINFSGTMGEIEFEWETADANKKLATAFDLLDIETIEIIMDVDTADAESAKTLLDQFPTDVKATIAAELQEGDVDAAKQIITDFIRDPENKLIELNVAVTDEDSVDSALNDFFSDIDAYNRTLNVVASMSADEESLAGTITKFETVGYRADGSPIEIKVPVEAQGVDDVKAAIDDIPPEKQIEIALQGDIDTELAQIVSSAELAQAAFEYAAMVDIAQIESASAEIQAAFESIGGSVSSMTGSISSMFSDLVTGFSSGELTRLQEWHLQDMVEAQQEAQNALIAAQVELTIAQAEYMAARTEALSNGESLITIDSNGLEPALEMVMWEIIEKVQVRATEEAADFLLGVGV